MFAVTMHPEWSIYNPETVEEKEESPYPAEAEMMVVNSVREERRRTVKAGICTFYLPTATQRRTVMPVYAQDHGKDRIHVKRQLRDGRITGISNLKNYYSNMRNLKAAKAVDVCYKILGTAIEKRLENAEKKENKGSKEYIAAAVHI